MPPYQTPPPDAAFEQGLIDVLLGQHGGRSRGVWIDFLCIACNDGENPSAGYDTERHLWNCLKCGTKGSWNNLAKRLKLETPTPDNSEVPPIIAQHDYYDLAGKHWFTMDRFQWAWVREWDAVQRDGSKKRVKTKAKCMPRLPHLPAGVKSSYRAKVIETLRNEGMELPLYRMQELAALSAGSLALVCEGEKDVESAESLGFFATTNPFGAGAGDWERWAPLFRGHHVVLVADHDEAGYLRIYNPKKQTGLATFLKPHAASLRVLTFAHLDGFPAKGDLTDWLTFGNVRKDSSHLRMLIEGAPTAETWIAAQGAPPSEGALPEFPCTVDGNALRLYHYFKDDLLYCPEDDEQWRVWRDPVWRRTKGSALISYARKLPAKIVEEAKATPKALRRLDLEKWEIQSQNTKVVQGAITLARGEERWWVEEDQFDRHPFLLACKNGVIDLETGKLHEHGRREDYLSRQSPIAFDRKCPTPNFTAYLKHLCGDDAELRKYTLQTLGRSLAGLQSKRPFFMLLGVKDTGKSTLLKLGSAILGPQLASSIRPEVIMEVRNEPHLTYLMTLRGKRLITFSECKQTHIMDRGAIKRFTGGDEIRANAMRQDEVSFHSECTLLVVSNEMPKTIGNDDAFYARLKIIRFKNSWTGPVDEMYFERSLKPELPGILPQLVDACLDWQHNPFQPQSVTDEVEAYRRSQDVVQIYADEHLVKLQPDVAESRTHCSRVYGDFQGYCHDWGERRVPSGQEFNKRLETMGFIKDRKGGDTVWLNLGLLDHDHVSERYESRTYLPTNQ